MFSYVFMKILEGRPASYDREMNRASDGRVRAIKEAVVTEIPSGSRVVEIGCGTGELASMLVARGDTVEGFDLNRRMVQAARDRIREEDLGDRFTVRQMGVDGMDCLPDGAYDAVVSTLVLSELSADERRFALRQAARVLAPGGLVVLADEVIPRSAGRRLGHALVRTPLLLATYLATGRGTQPLGDLVGELTAAGFLVRKETRSHGDAFALVVGQRDGEPGGRRS